MISLEAQIESVLFFKGEPLSVRELAKVLRRDEPAIKSALNNLRESLNERGVTLIFKDDSVMLGTVPEMSPTIEEFIRDELRKDIGRAGLEALTIILYRGPITRSMIDYIRGVNSTFILRRLLVRGLIEKIQNPKDQRSFLYRPTFELLSFLGIKDVRELPEYDDVQREIQEFENQKDETTE